MREIISRLGPQDVLALGIGVGLFVVIALAWMLGALAAGFYANRLNRSAAWGFVALVVSPLTVFLLLFGLGPRADEDDDSIRISCPFCAEDIKPEARLCPHCRSDLTRTAAERLRPR
jgi:hypothetical protein